VPFGRRCDPGRRSAGPNGGWLGRALSGRSDGKNHRPTA